MKRKQGDLLYYGLMQKKNYKKEYPEKVIIRLSGAAARTGEEKEED